MQDVVTLSDGRAVAVGARCRPDGAHLSAARMGPRRERRMEAAG